MQDQLKEILKQQLRDVHAPDAIGWWPLAIGWWVLAIVLVAILTYAAWRLLRRVRRERYRKIAKTELENHFANWQKNRKTDQYLQNTSSVLRRIILHINQNESLTTVSGTAWVKVLEHHSNEPFTSATKLALAESLYQKDAATDVPAIHQELHNWVALHKRNDKQVDRPTLQPSGQIPGARND
ncbi:MAG: hypothetical protein ACI9FR_000346 [Cryomorphaceae bacterium]|jgi:hypothetical protein